MIHVILWKMIHLWFQIIFWISLIVYAVHGVTYLYPVRMFNKVDFPAPDGPIIAVNSPDRSRPLTFFKIVFTPEKKEKILVIDDLALKYYSYFDNRLLGERSSKIKLPQKKKNSPIGPGTINVKKS